MRYLFDQFAFTAEDGRLEHVASGEAVTLRPQVARMLLALLAAPNTVIDRDTLCRAVWGAGAVVDFEAGLAAIARELRQALDQLGGRAGLLETIPRRGFRFAATPREAPPPDDPPDALPARDAPRRWQLLAALAAAMGLVWLFAWWFGAGPAPRDEQPEWTLAVLPFERLDEETGEGARLELLLADALLVQLWRAELPGAVLVGRATLLPYQARDDVAGAVAADLGVRLLIEGSIVRDSGAWHVTARLLDMPGGRVLWSDTLEWTGVPELPIRESALRLVEDLAASWGARPPGH
jgi:DNA-binding winged helix-turn-helix (wHTH) protein/TolB-like protein